MANNVAVNQDFKGITLLNYKIRQGQASQATENITVDGNGKLNYWDAAANAGAGQAVAGLDTRDIATDLSNILGGQTLAGAATAKAYADSKISDAPAFTETDVAPSARATKDYTDTAIAAIASSLAGGWVIREDLALDFTGDPLAQLSAAAGVTAIKKGQAFVVGVGGTFGGKGYDAGDMLVAKTDSPSLADLNGFHFVESTLNDASELRAGIVKTSADGDTTSTGNVVISPAQVKAMIDNSGAAKKALATIPANNLVGAGAATGIVIPHGIQNDNCIYSFRGTTSGDRYTLGLKAEANGTVTVYSDVDVTEEIAVTIVG